MPRLELIILSGGMICCFALSGCPSVFNDTHSIRTLLANEEQRGALANGDVEAVSTFHLDTEKMQMVQVSVVSNHLDIDIKRPKHIALRFKNTSTYRIVLPAPEPICQWLEIVDDRGVAAPSTIARVIDPEVPSEKSFLVLMPGQEVTKSCALSWVRDKSLRKAIVDELVPDPDRYEVLDTVTDYVAVSSGRYKMRFYRPSRPVDYFDSLRRNGEWVPVEDYFNAILYVGKLISDYVDVEFVHDN